MSLKSSRRRTAAGIVGSLAAAALLLSGCSTSPDSGSGGESTVTVFNGATGTITENFNPFSTTALQPTLGVIFESLYWYNAAQDEDPVPVLATGYEWNDEGTELTITTREGVKWSDGEDFSAEDVAFTFNLVAETPELNTSGLSATAEATDENTVVLTFDEQSFMQEPSVLGNRGIVPEHIWKDVADPITEINSNPVGTGPYTVESFSAQSYLLAKNENYWEEGKPAIDKVRYISLENADSASAALLAGDVDWMSSFLPSLEKLIADNPDLSYVNTPALTTSIFTCSNADLGCSGPQTDPAVRQALYYGIDREQLNALAGGGFAGTASPTLVLPERDARWISDTELTETPSGAEVDEAKRILDEAGWTEGSDGIREKDGERLSLSIQTVSGWSDYISLNDAMTQQLAEVGIELKPTQLSWNEWNNNQTLGQYQLSLDSIGLQPSNNPYFTYDKWYNSSQTAPVGESASAGNAARYSNPTVDDAVRTAGATSDEAVQAEQYGIIQAEIARDMPYIPIYVNSMLTEFNTSNAVGWPSNDDPYALAASWKSWDNGVILKNITPAK
ncbi:peptide/nickel transport system substrate-binding protein [Labedella gwakjiensis]|uniref:ABC transporter substrate-binding protein n=1 Tax=Labedella gwakjiensis TaxID=390269 RepID=A0A2P8GSS2_9MICO|nr:ABC transporter substrate-binding protein [Labedella gwakjiensis]PSL37018.1 peptide/nickel transport system substrate-binding protein [Labedella gwakjiensis]RUQ81825.1 ABC transporter substrate-binding protein [Labedella gwakjiensis]